MLIANKNLEAIYGIIDYSDIVKINNMIQEKNGLIVRINLQDMVPIDESED